MAEKNPFNPTDKEVVQQLITRLRLDPMAKKPRIQDKRVSQNDDGRNA
jgi:hypothetical protein